MTAQSAWRDGQQAWERLARRTDPTDALGDVRLVRRLLDEKERDLVILARREDRPWSEIGAALGISRQAAWERWHEVDPMEKEV